MKLRSSIRTLGHCPKSVCAVSPPLLVMSSPCCHLPFKCPRGKSQRSPSREAHP